MINAWLPKPDKFWTTATVVNSLFPPFLPTVKAACLHGKTKRCKHRSAVFFRTFNTYLEKCHSIKGHGFCINFFYLLASLSGSFAVAMRRNQRFLISFADIIITLTLLQTAGYIHTQDSIWNKDLNNPSDQSLCRMRASRPTFFVQASILAISARRFVPVLLITPSNNFLHCYSFRWEMFEQVIPYYTMSVNGRDPADGGISLSYHLYVMLVSWGLSPLSWLQAVDR